MAFAACQIFHRPALSHPHHPKILTLTIALTRDYPLYTQTRQPLPRLKAATHFACQEQLARVGVGRCHRSPLRPTAVGPPRRKIRRSTDGGAAGTELRQHAELIVRSQVGVALPRVQSGKWRSRNMGVRIRVCRHPVDLAAFELFDLPHCLGTCSTCPAPRRLKMDRRYYAERRAGTSQAPTADAPAIRWPLLHAMEPGTVGEPPVLTQGLSSSASHRVVSR